MPADIVDFAALVFFLSLWIGYTRFASAQVRRRPCLAGLLHTFRRRWMLALIERDNRVADTTIIANIERTVTFLASSTMLIIAGLLTVMASSEKAMALVSALPFTHKTTPLEWELKLLLLVSIFIYAFFKFTWALRQVGFCAVMVGHAPMPGDATSADRKDEFAEGVARVLSMAGAHFNYGLRSYYFGVASLAWFFNAWVFMAATVAVVGILYQREFASSALHALQKVEASTR